MKYFFLSLFLGTAMLAQAQPGATPATWTFTAKKTADKTYEIHMTATLSGNWHIYSQAQPADAIAIPTTFTLNKNPLLTLTGKIKEVGKMEVMKDAKLGVSANQYSGKVDFVQVVKLKAVVKTNLGGSVEYQVCNDEKCLPPKTVPFSVTLQ